MDSIRYIQVIKNLLKDGFAHVFVGTFFNKAVAMISSVVVARIVDKTDYAYLTYSETLYGYLTLFLGLGMSTALLKVCSGKETTSEDKAYLAFALKYGVVFEILITTLFCVSVCLLVLPFPQSKTYIVATVLYPTIYYGYDLLTSFVRSKQQNKAYAWYSLTYSFVTCVLTIAFVLLFSAMGVVVARYMALVLMIGFLWHLLKGKLVDLRQSKLSNNNLRQFMAMSVSLMAANALSGMMPINENLLVGNIIADEATTANFRVAGLFPQMVILVAQSVMIYYFPIIAEMDNKHRNSRRMVLKIAFLNAGLVFGAIIIGMCLTPWLIVTCYSEKYVDAVPIAMLLWLVHGINAAFRIVPINMLIAIRKYQFNLYMNAVSVIIQFLLGWYFLTKFGIYGVMYGTALIYGLTSILYWIYYLKYSKSI